MSCRLTLSLAAALLFGCGAPATQDSDLLTDQSRFSSSDATLLNFSFDGQMVTRGGGSRALIDAQLLYTMGQLNGNRSVGRLDNVKVTAITNTVQADGTTLTTYHAELPVAWGSKTSLPTSYELKLPKDASYDGLSAFTAKYKESCVDWSAHDVDSGSMWYYYRPSQSGCSIAEADLVRITAKATLHVENTTGKYPEYDKVWADNELNIVAIWGKYEDGATTSGDAGISAYNNFIRSMKRELAAYGVTTLPASVPDAPGVAISDVTFTAVLPDGKRVVVTALLVDNVRTAGAAFDSRYAALSTTADVIMYNGHAGLGSNVRALARKGKFVAGKYLIVFMNGCDTFAYVDGYMAQTRALINPDDPTGTKYMDIVTNAMPSYFHSMSGASTSMMKALMAHATPVTYETMFKSIDRAQVVVVTGEEDNTFTPGGVVPPQDIMKESGAVTKNQELRYKTAELKAGTYSVVLAHDAASPGGDADLYVKTGAQPTPSVYDCRPYKNGSAETCKVTLAAPATIYVSVFGYANRSSAFLLSIKAAQ